MYFSLDFGGTNFRISWTDSLDNVDVNTQTVIIKNTANYLSDSKLIFNTMKSKSTHSEAIVVALPGDFDHQKIALINTNNLKSWINKPFFRRLKQEFNCRLIIDKDTSVAAIGEGLNNNLPTNKFLYISWGTGIGGCLLSTKKGHLPVPTVLGWKKTFTKIDAFCGGGHALVNFGSELKKISNTQWDVLVENFVTELEKICHKYHLKYVVLGGGVTTKKASVVLKIQRKLKEKNIILTKSQLGDFSAIYGGYALLSSKLV